MLIEEEVQESVRADSCQGDVLAAYFRDAKYARLLSASEERDLFMQAKQGESGVHERIIEANLHLVISIARTYRYRGLDLLDLIQEGNLGLMRAVEKFQLERNCRLSTYATRWIHSFIRRALSNYARTIRIPVHHIEVMNRYTHFVQSYERVHGYEPDEGSIIRELGLNSNGELDQIWESLEISRNVSLNQKIAKDFDSAERIECIQCPNSAEFELKTDNKRLRRHIYRAFKSLLPIEQKVLRFHLGKNLSHVEIQNQLGWSYVEKVIITKKKALKKMQSALLRLHREYMDH